MPDAPELERIRRQWFRTGLISNAATARQFGDSRFEDSTFQQIAVSLEDLREAIEAGDLRALETLLASQAVTLNAIFTRLATVSAENIEDSLSAGERLLRLALKAQSQSRATIESLAMIKNPTSPVFARQANIAHGPQQVNNVVAARPPETHAGSENAPNELLEAPRDPERLDAAAASEAGKGDQAVATVDAVHRPAHGAGEGDVVHERLPRRRTAPSAAVRTRTPGA